VKRSTTPSRRSLLALQPDREYSVREVKEYLHEHTRLRDGERLLRSPDDAVVMVAGGIGNYSSVIHSMNAAGNDAVTVSVD
jgi:hypothetical protein